MSFENIINFATPREREILELVMKLGSQRKAAKHLGVVKSTVDSALARVRVRAAKALPSEHDYVNGAVPEGFGITGVSQYDSVERKWIKTSRDADKQAEILNTVIAAMCDSITPEPPVSQLPAFSNPDLCNLYTFSDFHMGMMAWEKESGAEWNIAIAEKVLWDSFKKMVDAAPEAETAVINIQGDFMHSDGLLPLTPKHKNVLDVAGRFSQIVDASIKVIRKLIAHALKKHLFVHLIIVEGNHDEASSIWLRKLFAALYEDEPRLNVNDSELPYYVFEFGDVMMGFHHGHKVNNEQLPLLFASQFPAVWGRTRKRVVHCGHRHHSDEKEFSGMTVVQHPTISARDAHGARGGWIAERSAIGITYHNKYGQVGRVYVSPEMLE